MSIVKIFVPSMLFWLTLSLQTSSAYDASSVIWPEGKATFKVNFYGSDSGTDPGGIFKQAFVEALETWTNTSTFEFGTPLTGSVNPCDPSETGNGVHFADTSCGTGFDASTVAIQISLFSNGFRTRTGITFNSAKSWAVYDDASGQGEKFGKVDFSRVAMHELGHSIGLDHPCDGGNPSHCVSEAIMEAFTSELLVPQADDLAGVASMYDKDSDGVGVASDNCPSISNASQTNSDTDALGDACDGDDDNDGVFDSITVDQSNGLGDLDSVFYTASSSGAAFAQTFTVGVSGLLQSVQLPVYCPSGDLQLSIRTVSGASPSSTVLDSNTIDTGLTRTNQGFVTIPLNEVSVISGDILAIVLDSSGQCRWTTTSSFYTGGTGRFSNNRSSWFALSGGEDLPFATVISPPVIDNCLITFNPDQVDIDGDGLGYACEDNDDDDVVNGDDNCPDTPNADQLNFDGDSEGDQCDDDMDNDGALDINDSDDMNNRICSDDDMDMCDDCSNGQYSVSTDGTNSDDDGICNLTDPNDDNDAWLDGDDNCPTVANDDQKDSNENGIGDACESGICVPIKVKSGAVAVICL
ncbi:MAG: hypothetical protein ACI9FR_000350 [Cryomorphaceae bacterium]|jgi:hypothetical protein